MFQMQSDVVIGVIIEGDEIVLSSKNVKKPDGVMPVFWGFSYKKWANTEKI